ncbi:MAG: hypothetical protein JWP20_2090 [Roseomonas sp.]|nr:hypothetical protein [Roseomonas sp.]
MIDTPKDSPGRNPPPQGGKNGGNDARRDRGRGQPPAPGQATPQPRPAEATIPPAVAANSPAAPPGPSTPLPGPSTSSFGPSAPPAGPSAPAGLPEDRSLSGGRPAPASAGRLPPPPPPPARKRDALILPIAAGGGIVVLLLAWLIVANRPDVPVIDPARLDALEGRVAALAPLPDRLGAIEAQGNAQGPVLQRADQRLGALEAALRERVPVTLEALNVLRDRLDKQDATLAGQQQRADGRIAEVETSLSQRLAGAEAQLAQRVAASEAALAPKLAALDTSQQQRIAALENTLQQRLAAAEQASRQATAERQAQMDARFATLEQREARITAAEQRLNRLVASTAITMALEAGKPLGPALAGLPGTPPPALTRYATAAPPTTATLRLSFDDAVRAARAAAEPATTGQGVLEAAATRLSNLVTIRRGDAVVWGDAISGELEGARQALDAGDLAGAVQKVEALPEAARAPMGGWLEQARGLIAARAALAELVAMPRGQG